MPTIITSPEEANCSKCLVPLEEECIKCSRCSVLTHLRCSDLPDYMLLRLKTSQASYICRACVLAEGDPESLAQQTQKIVLIMEKEEQTIRQAADEANTSNNEKAEDEENEMPGESQQARQADLNVKAPSDKGTTQKGKKSICKFFKSRTCKHGAKGDGCPYLHPPKCLSFLKHGTKGKRGCKKGDKCDRFHPKLCFNSVNRGVCVREDCNFHHISGTRRTEPENRQTYAQALTGESNPGGRHQPRTKHVASGKQDGYAPLIMTHS